MLSTMNEVWKIKILVKCLPGPYKQLIPSYEQGYTVHGIFLNKHIFR